MSILPLLLFIIVILMIVLVIIMMILTLISIIAHPRGGRVPCSGGASAGAGLRVLLAEGPRERVGKTKRGVMRKRGCRNTSNRTIKPFKTYIEIMFPFFIPPCFRLPREATLPHPLSVSPGLVRGHEFTGRMCKQLPLKPGAELHLWEDVHAYTITITMFTAIISCCITTVTIVSCIQLLHWQTVKWLGGSGSP